MHRISKRSQAELSMIIVAFIWGTTFVIVKNALNDIGPFLFLGLRFLIAFGVLAILAYPQMKQINRHTVAAGSLLGFFLFIGYIFQTVGLQYTTSSNAGFITGLNVVLVPIIYSLLYRKLPAFKTVISVILAATGLFLLSFTSGTYQMAYGDTLVLICAFGFAFHIVFVDKYSGQHNAVAITGMQILFVGILCTVIGLIIEPWPAEFTFNAWGAILITAVFATSLAFLLQNAMQKYSTPTRFAVVLTMEPVFAAMAGCLWAEEILTSRDLAGACLILTSMLISILIQSRKSNEEEAFISIKNIEHRS